MSEVGDDKVVYIEFGSSIPGMVDYELAEVEAKWTLLDGIIRNYIESQGNQLALQRINRIERD